MTDDDIERAALGLIERALDLEDSDRRGWLEASGADRRVVARALAFLDSLERTDGLVTGAATFDAAPSPMPERIGIYRTVRRLGEGGMGAVYLARRDAGDFDHEVAIKVVRPGAFSEELIERFTRERQILARLSHPNIARLFDGGTTADGGPFIVMEYVEGVPIDEWADAHGLALDGRLALVSRVCAAVGHAHQNLVIHRDLTPGNVLVTAEGEPKLIDFGIARPSGQDEGETSPPAPGAPDRLSHTPGFAAPERFTGVAATTLTDVYSIGRLLAVLTQRWSDDPDLSAIVARATAAAPDARYPGAGALAEDIARYRTGRPVAARDGGRRYVAAKFVRRNRKAVLAALAGLALVLAGLAGTSIAYAGAEKARRAEAARFEQLRALANFMLFDLNDRLERVAGTTHTRAALVAQARAYLEILADSPDPSPALLRDIARGFVRLAAVQGVPGHPNIGDPGAARASLDEAERLLLSLGAPEDPTVAAPLARAHAYRSLILLHAESKPRDAAAQIGAALGALRGVPFAARDWAWLETRSLVRRAQLESADLANETDGLARLARQLIAEIAQWPEAHRASPRAGLDRAIGTQYLATAHYNSGDRARYAEGLALFREADALYAEVERAAPNDPIALYWRGWNAYYGYATAGTLGRDAESARLLQQARESAERLLAIEANESITTFAERLRESQAELFVNQGRHAEAIALQRQVVDGRAAKVTAARSSSSLSDLAYGQAILGAIARRAGDRTLACESWTQAEALIAEVDGRGDLRGFLRDMRAGVVANLARCAAGAPVRSFTPLS